MLDEEYQDLKRENFNLKLRIYFLEEQSSSSDRLVDGGYHEQLSYVQELQSENDRLRRRVESQISSTDLSTIGYNFDPDEERRYLREELEKSRREVEFLQHRVDAVERDKFATSFGQSIQTTSSVDSGLDTSGVPMSSIDRTTGRNFQRELNESRERERKLVEEINSLKRRVDLLLTKSDETNDELNRAREQIRFYQSEIKKFEQQQSKAERVLQRLQLDYEARIAHLVEQQQQQLNEFENYRHEPLLARIRFCYPVQDDEGPNFNVDEYRQAIDERDRIIRQLEETINETTIQLQAPLNTVFPSKHSDQPWNDERIENLVKGLEVQLKSHLEAIDLLRDECLELRRGEKNLKSQIESLDNLIHQPNKNFSVGSRPFGSNSKLDTVPEDPEKIQELQAAIVEITLQLQTDAENVSGVTNRVAQILRDRDEWLDKINRLEREVEEKNAVIRQIDRRENELETRVHRQFATQIENLQQQIRERDQRLKDFYNQKENLKIQLTNEYEKLISQLNQDKQNLQGQLRIAEDEIQRLQQQSRDERAQLQQLQQQSQRSPAIQAQIEQLENRIRQQTGQLEQNQRVFQEAETDFGKHRREFEREIEFARRKISELENALNLSNRKANETKNEADQLKSSIEQRIEEFELQIRIYQEKVSSFDQEKTATNELNLHLQHENELVKDRARQLENLLNEATRINEELKSKISLSEIRSGDNDGLNKRYRAEIDQLQRDLAEVSQKNDEKLDLLHNFEREFEGMKIELKRCEEEKARFDNENLLIREENERLKSELDQLIVRIRLEVRHEYEEEFRQIENQKSLEIEAVQRENDLNRMDLERTNQDRKRIDDRNRTLENSLRQANETLEKYEEDVRRLRGALDAAQKRSQQLEEDLSNAFDAELKQKTERINDFERKLRNAEKQKIEDEKVIYDLRRENQILIDESKKIQDVYENNLLNLRRENQRLIDELNRARDDDEKNIQKLRRDNEQLGDELDKLQIHHENILKNIRNENQQLIEELKRIELEHEKDLLRLQRDNQQLIDELKRAQIEQENHLVKLKRDNQQLNDQIQNLEAEYENDLSKLAHENQQLMQELKRLRMEHENVQILLQNQQQKISDELSKARIEYENDLSRLKRENQQLIEDLNRARTEQGNDLSRLKRENQQLIDELNKARTEQGNDLSRLKRENQQLVDELNKARAEQGNDLLRLKRENQQLVDELNKARTEQGNDLSRLKRENQQLIDELNKARAEHENDLLRLQREIQQLVEELKRARLEQENELRNLSRENQQLVDELNKSRADRDNDLRNLRRENQQLNEELLRVRTDQDNNLKNLGRENQRLVDELNRTRSERGNQFESLQRDNKRLSDEFEQYRINQDNNLKNLRQSIDEDTKRNSIMQEERLRQEFDRVNENKQARIDQLEQKLRDKDRLIQELENERKSLKSRPNEFQVDLEILIEQLEQQVQTKERFIKTYSDTIQQRNEQIDKLLDQAEKDEKNDSSSLVQTLREEVQLRDRKLEENYFDLAQLESQKTQLENLVRNRDRDLFELNEKLRRVEQSFQIQQRELDDCRQRRDTAITDLNFVIEENQRNVERIENLQQQLEMSQSRSNNAEQFAQFQTIIKDLKGKLQQRENSLQTLQRTLSESDKEVQEPHENDYHLHENENGNGKNRFDAQNEDKLKFDVEERDQLIASLRKKLNEKEEEINKLRDNDLEKEAKLNFLRSKSRESEPESRSEYSAARAPSNVSLRLELQRKDDLIDELRRQLDRARHESPGSGRDDSSSNTTGQRPSTQRISIRSFDNFTIEQLRYELETALRDNDALIEQLSKRSPSITELHNQLLDVRKDLARQKYINQVLWRKLDALMEIQGSNTRAELMIELASFHDEIEALKAKQQRTNDARSAILNPSSRSSSETSLNKKDSGLESVHESNRLNLAQQELQRGIHERDEEIKRLTKELNEIRKHHEIELNQFRQKFEKTQTDLIDDLNNKHDDLRQARLQVDLLKSTRTQLEQAQDQNQRLQSELKLVKNEVEEKRGLIVHYEQQIGLLEKQISSRAGGSGEMSIRTSEMAELLEEMKRLRLDLERSISKQNELQAKLDENLRQSRSAREFSFSGRAVSYGDVPLSMSEDLRTSNFHFSGKELAERGKIYSIGEIEMTENLRRCLAELKLELKGIEGKINEKLRTKFTSAVADPSIEWLEHRQNSLSHAIDALERAYQIVESFWKAHLPVKNALDEHLFNEPNIFQENKELKVTQARYIQELQTLKQKCKDQSAYIDQILSQLMKANMKKANADDYLALLLRPTLDILQKARANMENHLKDSTLNTSLSTSHGQSPRRRARPNRLE